MIKTLTPSERSTETRYAATYDEYLGMPDDGKVVEWVNGEVIDLPVSVRRVLQPRS